MHNSNQNKKKLKKSEISMVFFIQVFSSLPILCYQILGQNSNEKNLQNILIFEFWFQSWPWKYFEFEFETKTQTQLNSKFRVQNLHWLYCNMAIDHYLHHWACFVQTRMHKKCLSFLRPTIRLFGVFLRSDDTSLSVSIISWFSELVPT